MHFLIPNDLGWFDISGTFAVSDSASHLEDPECELELELLSLSSVPLSSAVAGFASRLCLGSRLPARRRRPLSRSWPSLRRRSVDTRRSCRLRSRESLALLPFPRASSPPSSLRGYLGLSRLRLCDRRRGLLPKVLRGWLTRGLRLKSLRRGLLRPLPFGLRFGEVRLTSLRGGLLRFLPNGLRLSLLLEFLRPPPYGLLRTLPCGLRLPLCRGLQRVLSLWGLRLSLCHGLLRLLSFWALWGLRLWSIRRGLLRALPIGLSGGLRLCGLLECCLLGELCFWTKFSESLFRVSTGFWPSLLPDVGFGLLRSQRELEFWIFVQLSVSTAFASTTASPAISKTCRFCTSIGSCASWNPWSVTLGICCSVNWCCSISAGSVSTTAGGGDPRPSSKGGTIDPPFTAGLSSFRWRFTTRRLLEDEKRRKYWHITIGMHFNWKKAKHFPSIKPIISKPFANKLGICVLCTES